MFQEYSANAVVAFVPLRERAEMEQSAMRNRRALATSARTINLSETLQCQFDEPIFK
jgi:hypothetical protein